jgi:hydroxymethylpyrimidine pyrophosphatase-like HAD family hydrolase
MSRILQRKGTVLAENSRNIRLLVFDIDGVLTQGETKALDLRLLEQLADMNRAARQDPSRPAITLASGRPAPYVEAFLQAIDGHVAALFEHGTGLYIPDGYRFLSNPAMGEPLKFEAVRRRLRETLLQTGQVFFQPGKEYSLSIFPRDPAQIGTLYDQALAALGPLRESVDLLYSTSCLNVLPRGLHKGKGIEFLSSQTGYARAEMLGVGDSDIDLAFLATVGHSAAPVNANPRVKQLVQYVAPRTGSDGVRDILAHYELALR